MTPDIYLTSWKYERNYYHIETGLPFADSLSDFFEELEAIWRKSLPDVYTRRSVFKQQWLESQINLRHDPSTFDTQLDWRTVRTNLSVPHILDSFTLTRRRDYGGKSTFCCPWHEDSTPSLSFSHDKKVYYCFSAGCKGSIFDFVMKMNDCSFGEAVRYCNRLS